METLSEFLHLCRFTERLRRRRAVRASGVHDTARPAEVALASHHVAEERARRGELAPAYAGAIAVG